MRADYDFHWCMCWYCKHNVAPIGLEQAVVHLSVGERAKCSMPADLAYKEKGFPGLIPPRTALMFDIELIAIT